MQIEGEGELNKTDEKYAIYSLCPEDARFIKRFVSTKICVSSKATYKIYNYDKTILSSLDTFHDKYRAVVFGYPENELLSFSPPKSIEYADFTKKYPIIQNIKYKWGSPMAKIENLIVATEKIEGVSINLFYDKRINLWEISTKTNIGGNYWYYTRKSSTFYDMFLDALIQPRNTQLNDNPWIRELPKSYSYSFVLQHPENPIVIPIKSPKLYLVAVYEIRNSLRDSCAIHIPSSEYKNWPVLMSMEGVIYFPKQLDVSNYQELQKYASKYIDHPFRLAKGIVLWNEKTGERTLLNNPNYNELLQLREMSPGFQYEYFCIKRIGKLTEYMNYYPQTKKMIMQMENIYTEFVKNLHKCYMDVYVFKKELLNNINPQFRHYVEKLHKNIYLNNFIK